MSVSRYPVLSDLESLAKRLARQERELSQRLAELEAQIRDYENNERPGYERWIRLELGPQFQTLEEIIQSIRERRFLVERVQEVIDREGLHPREALFAILHPEGKGEENPSKKSSKSDSAWDQEEIEARRRAKLEAKREARRQEKKSSRKPPEKTSGTGPVEPVQDPARRKLVSLYRALARRLHPDAVGASAGERVQKLWLEVQEAYENRNVERLIAIEVWLLSEQPEEDSLSISELTLSERYERLRSMERSYVRLEKTLRQYSAHPAWAFSEVKGSARKKLFKFAARQLEDEIAQAQEALDAIEELIESIGPPRQPRKRAR